MTSQYGLTPRKAAKPRVRADLVVTDELHLARRSTIVPGTELTIEGLPRRWTFIRYVRRVDGADWVDVMGDGRRNARGLRTVRADRITTVHRGRKTDDE
jgi:hypothetical protein